MSLHFQNKSKLVNSVFSEVYQKYDLMNDIMSLGVHRLWKKNLIKWMKPANDASLIDVASGTGDIAKLFNEKTLKKSKIVCVEPNTSMMNSGKKNLKNFKNIQWVQASAENLPFKDESFDYYTISFGIRNVTSISKSLNEANRVLKTGGRFMCLEFSKVENELLQHFYNYYSKGIPFIGKYIVGNSKPYKYLIESIEKFPSQIKFKNMIEEQGFEDVQFRNLSNGIAAIHSGWKI